MEGVLDTKVPKSRISRSLSTDELNEIIQEANVVWQPPQAPPPSSVPYLPLPDISCDVILFDGQAVTKADCFGGPGKGLVKAIRAIELPW